MYLDEGSETLERFSKIGKINTLCIFKDFRTTEISQLDFVTNTIRIDFCFLENDGAKT